MRHLTRFLIATLLTQTALAHAWTHEARQRVQRLAAAMQIQTMTDRLGAVTIEHPIAFAPGTEVTGFVARTADAIVDQLHRRDFSDQRVMVRLTGVGLSFPARHTLVRDVERAVNARLVDERKYTFPVRVFATDVDGAGFACGGSLG